MVNFTCNGMRILVVFVDIYENCDHLFFGFVFVYGHFCLWALCLSWSLCLTVDPSFHWVEIFSVCMCYLVKQNQNQKKSRKCGPSVCVASQKQN